MQKFRDKLIAKSRDNLGIEPVMLAFLGDSVTQGCFEVYQKSDGGIETVYDSDSAYHQDLKKSLSLLYPNVPVNILNAGISGDNAVHGLERLDRDILRYQPDLCVVCFGLNDVWNGENGLAAYRQALENIFCRLREDGTEVVFMTPNMMCTHISCHLHNESIRQTAQRAGELQNSGMMDRYMQAAREVCIQNKVTICDCYAQWQALAFNGVDTTELLANKINHPSREMNWLFAASLLHTIMTAP